MGKELREARKPISLDLQTNCISHIKKDATKNATQQYEILKKEFDLYTVTTYSLFYR